MIGTGASSRIAVTHSMFRLPMSSANAITNEGPAIAPRLDPAAMTPNSRFGCYLLKSPVMNVQKTDKWNKPKTLAQT